MKEVNKNIDLIIPEPKKSLWVVKNINVLEVFDNEKDILVYMKGFYQTKEDYEKEKEELVQKINDLSFLKMIERMNIIEPELFRYDYLEELGDLMEVFAINTLQIVDSKLEIQKTTFKTLSDKNIAIYSNDGVNWNYNAGDIQNLYFIFENKGIEFKKEISKKKTPIKKYTRK